MRIFMAVREVSIPMQDRYPWIDEGRAMALVAMRTLRAPGPDGEFGETSSIIADPDLGSCEFSLPVDDRLRGQGLGTRLKLATMDVARA
jgi:acetyltransferase